MENLPKASHNHGLQLQKRQVVGVPQWRTAFAEMKPSYVGPGTLDVFLWDFKNIWRIAHRKAFHKESWRA